MRKVTEAPVPLSMAEWKDKGLHPETPVSDPSNPVLSLVKGSGQVGSTNLTCLGEFRLWPWQ